MGIGLRRAFMFGLAVLVFFLAAYLPAKADQEEQNPTVTIKVKGAYGNYSRPRTWVPVRVEVSNQGPDIKGKLRLSQTVNSMGPSSGVDYVTPAVLPQGSTKQFELTVPVNDFLNSFKVELVSGTDVVAEGKGEFTFLGPEQLVIGLLDRSADDFAALGSMKLSTNFSPLLINVNSKELSNKPEVLALFNVVVADDVNFKLQPEQAKALSDWVSRGGTLIVGGGPGWQKVYPNLPQDLPGVKVSGEENIALPTMPSLLSKQNIEPLKGPVDILKFEIAGGNSRFVEGGRALALEQPFGAGKVLYLAFDPALEPIAGWSGSKIFWEDLINFKGNTLNSQLNMKGDNNQGILISALNNIPAMELPSVRKIMGVLFVYLLLVTVVNYLVLKKLDRREWTWITLPVLSLLFVVVIYFTSFQSRPSEIISNQITLVDVNPDSPRARLTSAIGIFAPTYNTYKVDLAGEYLVNPLPGYDETFVQTSASQKPPALVEVEQSPGQTSIELRKMRSWTMRGFATSGETRLAGTISAEITQKGNKWVAVVTNNTQYNFSEGVVLSNPFWFAKVGALNAGGKTEVEIPESSFSSSMGQPIIYQIYQPVFQSGMPAKPQAEDMLRQQVMSYLFEGSFVQEQLMFVGWSKQPVEGAFALKEGSLKQFYTTAFKVPLKIKVDSSDLKLPPGIITGTVIDSSNVGIGMPGVVYMQPNSQVTYQLDLPEGKFSTLEVYMQMGPPGMKGPMPGGAASWTTSLYNWNKESWEEVKLTNGANAIKDYEQYLNDQGQMRLKLDNKEGGFEMSGVSVALGKGGGK